MLATTQPEDIPQTIRSRCQHFSFRAVKFDDIVGQLRDLTGREKIEADDDALALLAEAGDGSMRDALSILDQAIASSNEKLTADSVRNLVGAAPAHILEEVMQAVARGASDEVLRQVDHLISEGHSPTHFARQLVRFLRNSTVAKVAGKDSSLLQISSEERERVERVAALFGEEDLTRHLQIMLRTHSELGYKQEQRFHLELGLLKMAHAQRLLPIEQLLSDVSSSSSIPEANASRNAGRPSIVASSSVSTPVAGSPSPRPNPVSPFAADSARKSTPRQESAFDLAAASAQRVGAGSPPPRVVMGAAAPADLDENAPSLHLGVQQFDAPNRDVQQIDVRLPQPETKPQTPPAPAAVEPAAPIERLRSAVLQALLDGNQRILVSMLEQGEWSVEGNEVVIKVSESQAVVDMSLGADSRRLAIAAASGILGRAVKLRIVPGAAAAPADGKRNGNFSGTTSAAGGRSRAEQDAVVRRMQEKFGAEIRTVIDYKEKR
jgi:DNA polymerase-3 subunit gamma/tau